MSCDNRPFTVDEALELALLGEAAESALVPQATIARIFGYLPAGQRPTWLLDRLAASMRVRTYVMLTAAEMITVAELVLGKTGEALRSEVGHYRAAVRRGDKPMPGKARPGRSI